MRPEETPRPTPPTRARRSRGLALAALIVLTLAVGVAARLPRGATATDPGDPVGASQTAGPIRLAAHLDRGSVLRGGDGIVRTELVIAAEADDAAPSRNVPTDLVVVLDRSGSMQGHLLAFAQAAVRELLEELAPTDRFALVTYATGGAVAIPLGPATDEARQAWRHQLSAVTANGGTNLARGLDLAHELLTRSRQAGRIPRVVLLSDGHANQGDHSLGGLRARASRAVGGEYVLSAVGVGQGFDETVMSAVADAGTGNFYYLPDLAALSGVFAAEFASARETVASALEVTIAPGPGVTIVNAAGYPLDRASDRVRFRPGDLAAGQERRIWVTLRAPTGSEGAIALGQVSLSFTGDDGERLTLRLPGLPTLACVPGEDDYYASFDAETYRRGSRVEALGALKQSVAGRLRAGEQAEAVSEVDGYLAKMKSEQLRALGYVDAEGLAPAEALRDAVAAPSAAAPEIQNQLGKQYLEEGLDLRRAGSKR